MSQNESTTFLVTDAKNLTLIDANRENSPWCGGDVNARTCDEASVRAFTPLARMWMHESSPKLLWQFITNIRT